MSLLDDLRRAQRETDGEAPCGLCEYIRAILDEETRVAMSAAAGGSIGIRKLEGILQAHETGIGRRTIVRHRNERHEP